VPFCSAWSKITSTSGWPVAWSTWPRTLAVISIRNESRSPAFQRDPGQEPLDQPVGVGAAPRHDAGAPQRPLLAPGHPGAEEPQPPRGHGLLAADGVLEEAVAAVDQQVALVQVPGQLLQHGVHRRSGLDHDQDAPGPGQTPETSTAVVVRERE
jgi:hypothetical protein